MTKIAIIIGSTRPGRNGEAVARWVYENAAQRSGVEYELVDLKDWDLPHLDEAMPAAMGQYAGEHTKAWAAKIAEFDGFVFVTPEYNHSFNAPLKNAIDFLYAEWQHKPVGFVSYGGLAAGTRAVQALKPVVAVLKMTPVVESVPIPFVGQLIDPQGQLQATDSLNRAAVGMFDELKRLDAILRPTRSQ
jgi:NAD(P)H-dependent FMN reductase